MKRAFVFPGQGSQAPGMGQALAEAFATGARAVRGSRRGAVAASVAADVRGSGKRADADRKRPAGAAGGEPRGHPRARSGGRLRYRPARRLCCRPFAWRVFGAGGGGRAFGRRRGAARQAARPGDAEGGAGRRGRDGGAARPRHRRGARGRRGGGRRTRSAPSPTTTARARSSSAAIAQAVERAVALAAEQGARRSIMLPVSAPFHSPLMAPGRRNHGRGARPRPRIEAPLRAARRQCDGGADQRPRRDQGAARRAGHADGALARERAAIRRRGGRGGRRDRRRAGARRPRQADRPRAAGDLGRHAGRGRSPRQAAVRDRASHVRSDRTDGSGDRRLRRHRRRDRAGAAPPGRRGRAGRHPRRRRLPPWPTELGERAHVRGRPISPIRQRPTACARGRGGDGPGRYPRQQCRHHPRQPGAADARRGLAGGHRRQSDRRLPADPRRVARHGAAPPRPGDLRSARSSGSPAMPARRITRRQRRR